MVALSSFFSFFYDLFVCFYELIFVCFLYLFFNHLTYRGSNSNQRLPPSSLLCLVCLFAIIRCTREVTPIDSRHHDRYCYPLSDIDLMGIEPELVCATKLPKIMRDVMDTQHIIILRESDTIIACNKSTIFILMLHYIAKELVISR